MRAIIELRVQAANDAEYQAQFTRSTEHFKDRFAHSINNGIDDGVFQAVDAERVASLVIATIDGAMLQQSTTDPTQTAPKLRELRAELDTYLDDRLLSVEKEATE